MQLINHVLNIRRLIQRAFDNRFSRLGLRADCPQSMEKLSDVQREKRKRLDELMSSHLKEHDGNYAEARQEAINECVFTLFNRIAAIKVMETKEFFPEVVRRRSETSNRSFAHNAWLEEHPEENGAVRDGLKHFLISQFEELGGHIPLFKMSYPYSLMPTADELNEIIEAFNAVEQDEDCGSDVWNGDDILGWLYENFNSVEKAALKESDEKTEYDKVSLQSQVYTPQWVVKFLVDNTLGKTYLEMYPDSEIREKYKIANAPTEQMRVAKDVSTLKVLDPACGSGNFLIYALLFLYDLYMNQIEQYGKDYRKRDIAKMIVENNLFGIDLDERAAQISQIALCIKAYELSRQWPKFTNVISTHFFLDDYSTVKSSFEEIDNLSENKIFAMNLIWDDLRSAYKFGSLIRVEKRLDTAMKADEGTLFQSKDGEGLLSFRNMYMTKLRNLVGRVAVNEFSLTKSNEAITFLDIISQKYDAVVANPPYTDSGDFGPELKKFVNDNYSKPYKVNTNLYACFIKRCCELASSDGKVGMVNPPTFMYIKTFESVRRFILEKTHINIFVEWGYLGMFAAFARVDSAMFILEMGGNYANSTFIKLNDLYEMKRKAVLEQAYCDYINGTPNGRVYSLPQSKLMEIESYPFIYWISDSFREKFNIGTLGNYVDTCKGMDTSNNERFLRFIWEVAPENISVDYETDHKKWVPYCKGGPYNKWYGNFWLTVNWKNDAYDLLHFVDSNGKIIPNIRNKENYFKAGITYSASGSKGTTFRFMPKNMIIDSGGPGIYCNTYDNIFYTLAVLNSAMSYYVCSCLNPTVNTTHGDLRRIPFVIPQEEIKTIVGDLSKQNVDIKKRLSQYSLIEPAYLGSPIVPNTDVLQSVKDFYFYENALFTQILLNESVLNEKIFEIYELNENDKKMVIEKEGIPVGNLPVSHEAKSAYTDWLQNNTEFPASSHVLQHLANLEECDTQPAITDFETLYQNNNEWEEFCKKHQMNPVEVWYQFKNANVLPPQRTQVLAFELLTDVIRSILAKDDDGVIPMSDRMGEERLSIRAEREFMERGYSESQFHQVVQLLGCDLEKYLQEKFFQQLSGHLNLFMYLPKTPFIWHLTSGPHHALELYTSIYKWNRDTLFRIKSIYAANRETMLNDRLNALDTSGAAGRIEASEIKDQLAELRKFCDKIDDLLASGYDPKLDDGVGKNIAPLQKRGMLSYAVLNAGQLKKYLNADW